MVDPVSKKANIKDQAKYRDYAQVILWVVKNLEFRNHASLVRALIEIILRISSISHSRSTELLPLK